VGGDASPGAEPAAMRESSALVAASSIASSLCGRKSEACAIKRFEATNVDATLRHWMLVPDASSIVLGGKDKGSDYTGAAKAMREKPFLRC